MTTGTIMDSRAEAPRLTLTVHDSPDGIHYTLHSAEQYGGGSARRATLHANGETVILSLLDLRAQDAKVEEVRSPGAMLPAMRLASRWVRDGVLDAVAHADFRKVNPALGAA